MTSLQTNPIALFNLRESPYFQDSLQASGRYPLSLFVAREDATAALLRRIEMSPGGTRQTIRGPAGVGKSTLAQYVKAQAAKRFGLLTVSAPASLGSAVTTDQICAQILRRVLDALLLGAKARGTDVSDALAVKQASQLARIYQTTTGRSGGAGVFGVNASAGSSDTLVTPSAATPSVVIQDLLPPLMDIARNELGAMGILLHLNNLDNIPIEQADRAAVILRDIRDTALMIDGYHWLVVGTDNAVRTIVDGVTQVRSVFHKPPPLAPLTDAELTALLDKRYSELRVDSTQPIRRPVEPEAAMKLYRLYGGDLRATFEALEAAISELLGTSANGVNAPLALGDIASFLTSWTRDTAKSQLDENGLDDLTSLGLAYGDAPFTRSMAQADILHTKNNATGTTFINRLLRFGYVREYPEVLQGARGRPATQYVITGATKLVAGVAYESALPTHDMA